MLLNLPFTGKSGCDTVESMKNVGAGLTAKEASLIKSVILVPHGIGDNAGVLSEPVLLFLWATASDSVNHAIAIPYDSIASAT